MEVILATLTSGSDSLILRSVIICSILYSKCEYCHNYTWSVDNHMYIHTCVLWYINVSRVQPNLNDARNLGGSELLNCNIPIRTDFQ